MARFDYYDDYTLEELEKERMDLIENIEKDLEILDNPKASGEQKSEIKNSDLKYDRERFQYVDDLIRQRNQRTR